MQKQAKKLLLTPKILFMLVEQNHLHKTPKAIFDFVKMSGASNDFVIIDNRLNHKKINVEIVKKICHRQNIG